MSLGPMGMNTGFDINGMVSKIVSAERVPKQQRIDNERTNIDTSISAYGRLRESLDTMKNLMTQFRQEKAFAVRKVDTSNEQVVSAAATTEAIAGNYLSMCCSLLKAIKLRLKYWTKTRNLVRASCIFHWAIRVLRWMCKVTPSWLILSVESMVKNPIRACEPPSSMMLKGRG